MIFLVRCLYSIGADSKQPQMCSPHDLWPYFRLFTIGYLLPHFFSVYPFVDELPKPEGNNLAPSPTSEADPSFDIFRPFPSLRVALVQKQLSMNLLRIKSIFSTARTGVQLVTRSACDMGWGSNLDVLVTSRSGNFEKGIKKLVGRSCGGSAWNHIDSGIVYMMG